MSGRVGSITTGIITDGLVFNMDAANRASYPRTGTTVTDTIGNLTGSMVGTSFNITDNATFNFDGIDDRIDLPNNIPVLTYGTLSMWFKIPSSTTNITNVLFSLYEGNSNRFSLSIGEATSYYSNESLMALFWNGGSASNISYAPVTREGHTHYFDDTWHNIVLIIDSGPAPRTKIYIDNVNKTLSYPFGSNTGTGFTNLSPSAVRIGDRFYDGADGQYFDGNIGPVHIYNRALSATEVLHNYNALAGRFGL